MKNYASLVGPLLGVYYPLPDELDTELLQRLAMNSSRLSKIWYSVYTEAEVDRQITEFGGTKLPDSTADNLDYDSHTIHEARKNSL